MSDLPTQPQAGPDQAAILDQAFKRGLLPPAQRDLYEQGLKRGLIKPQGSPQGAQTAPAAPTVAPDPSGAPAAPQVPDIANPLGAMGSAITRAPAALKGAQSGFAAKLKARQEDERLRARRRLRRGHWVCRCDPHESAVEPGAAMGLPRREVRRRQGASGQARAVLRRDR